MDHTFATVELLELILLEIDTQTLLTSASRVCRYWNDAIQHSVQLQTRLFFRPSTSDRYLDDDDGSRPAAAAAAACTNELLLRHFPKVIGKDADRRNNDERLSRPEASWRRMLVQQPPVKKLGVWRLDTGTAIPHGFRTTTEMIPFDHPNELTMESLVSYSKTLPQGYSWEVFTGSEARDGLAREKKSLFVVKSSRKERQALAEMWVASDAVVKLTRWVGSV